MTAWLDRENKLLFIYRARDEALAPPPSLPKGYRAVVLESGSAPLPECLLPLLRNHL